MLNGHEERPVARIARRSQVAASYRAIGYLSSGVHPRWWFLRTAPRTPWGPLLFAGFARQSDGDATTACLHFLLLLR